MPRPDRATEKTFRMLDAMDSSGQMGDVWVMVDNICKEQHVRMDEACRRFGLWVRRKGNLYKVKVPRAKGRYDEKLGVFVGFAPDGKEKCPVPRCEGGHIKTDVPWEGGLLPYSYMTCDVCNGTGWVDKRGDGNG